MAKTRTTWICQQCGASSPAYLGRCPSCGSWQSMVETIEERHPTSAAPRRHGRTRPQPLSSVTSSEQDRLRVPIDELNRVLGGGLVPGSLALIGGDPGIGKSTLILQAAAKLAASCPVVYVSAEESAQ